MSSEQAQANERTPVQIDSWEGLCRYTEFLRQGAEKKIKICVIDEEKEEIRLQTKDEFIVNVQYAQEHGIDSLTFVVYLDEKLIFEGFYKVPKSIRKSPFPVEKFQLLVDDVLAEKWYIPIKQDEALGICLNAAIELAKDNRLETVVECQRFVEHIVPEAFRKLQNTQSVHSWPRDIQIGIFELIELLVDLVGTRLRFPSVPVSLLNTLAMTFDTSTTFSQKHKNESIPAKRVYTLKEEDFLSNECDNEPYGWLRSIIQRFIAQNGLNNVCLQFDYINSASAAKEYNALLKLFAKCKRCVNTERFQAIFTRPIQQAIEYLQNQKASNDTTPELKELNETLLDICYKYDFKTEIDQLVSLVNHLNLYEMSYPSIGTYSEMRPLIETSKSSQRKTKKQDCYERLAEDLQTMAMTGHDAERQCVKKQRTEEQTTTNKNLLDCIDEILTASSMANKRTSKRKHRREQRATTHTNKKETKQIKTTYDRTNSEDILRHFAPMKHKIANLYEDRQLATANGKLREVLRIEEKLKLLNPFSARFIADENTPDGTIMRPGQTFRKSWILLNDGSMPWDNEDFQLINLADGIPIVHAPVIPVTAPHARTILSVDYQCAQQAGVYESKWILAYRQQTFGPMIWCSIEVSERASIKRESILDVPVVNDFEFIDVPLPACFDLSKPFDSLSRSESILDDFRSTTDESATNLLSLTSTITDLSETPLIELALSDNEHENASLNQEERTSVRSSQSLDFVDSVVTNIFSVAKQASSTAKAIFNTLQAYEEPNQQAKPALINTFDSTQTGSNAFFDRLEKTRPSVNSLPTKEPMQVLIEMGFANRPKNQRLLKENGNDLAKVIELLTLDTNDDVDCFVHRH